MTKARMKNLHVPLPDALHQKLRAAALHAGKPATELAREAIGTWLAEQERWAVHEQVREYARAAAGTDEDLDAGLEAAAVEELRTLEGAEREAS